MGTYPSTRHSFAAVSIACLAAAGSAVPVEDADQSLEATLCQQVGDGCQIRETDHWVIASHAEPKWVEAVAGTLERTHGCFFEQFKKAGFELQPIGRKLVCVLLGEQGEFLRYLERVQDSSNESPSAAQPPSEPGRAKRRAGLGSYSERTNRIQLCDIRSIRTPSAQTGDVARLEWENVARIAHEAAHQLAFNTGAMRQGVGYPTWLGEGLAANFEFAEADKPFGPLTTNLSPRAVRLKQLFTDRKLLPLKQMVTMSPYETHLPENKGPTYVQGWALFRFLFNERPAQLKRYLAALAERPRGPVRRRDVLGTFEAAFGPIGELDRDWQLFLQHFCSGAPNVQGG